MNNNGQHLIERENLTTSLNYINIGIPIIIARECGEVEIQIWANECSGSIFSVKFVKEEWNGFRFRLTEFVYVPNFREEQMQDFYKIIEQAFVNVLSNLLIEEAESNIVGTKKYFYFYTKEGQESQFEKWFKGVKKKGDILVYEAS